MTLKAILWDFDGTIIFFNIDAQRMRLEIFDYLAALDFQIPKGGSWKSIFSILQEAKRYFLANGRSPEEVKTFSSHVDHIINTIEVEGTDTAHLVPGVQEVIQQASSLGIRHAIITLNRSTNVSALLTQLGLIQNFDVIAGRDLVPLFKPDPAHTQYILDRLRLKPEDCLMIGDHPNDLETANAAHVSFAAVITERHPQSEFAGAKFFVPQDHMQDLLPIIRGLLEP